MPMMEMLFGKPKVDPKEQARDWDKKLRAEQRQLQRQIHSIEREEAKIKISLKQHAKKGEEANARVLAKSLAQSRKAKNRIHATKAQINSIAMEIRSQARMLRTTETLNKSVQVMKAMNNLVNIQQVSATMKDLSREMMKAGVIEEMMSDSIDAAMGDEDEVAEAADEEPTAPSLFKMNKVLWEITEGQMGEAPDAAQTALVGAAPESDEAAEAFIAQYAAQMAAQ